MDPQAVKAAKAHDQIGAFTRLVSVRPPPQHRASTEDLMPPYVLQRQEREAVMFAVIFEVEPKPARRDDYLAIAGGLRPDLERIDGFIANERFRSRQHDGRVLSLSIWRDEKAVVRWRTFARHYSAQVRGRADIFADYHLRVGEVIADNRPPQGVDLAPQRFDETEIGAAKLVTITEFASGDTDDDHFAAALRLPEAGTAGLVGDETYSGITEPKKRLLLASWRDWAAAAAWRPEENREGLRHRAVRIVRDYGFHDRREAPQYHPPVAP
jgi:heme-degrading monooxygenase HmoA